MSQLKSKKEREIVSKCDQWVSTNAIPYALFSVLLAAGLVVTHLTMNEKHDKEEEVEVGDGGVESGRQAPRKCHDPVSKIVRVPGAAPPAGRQELAARFGGHEFEICEAQKNQPEAQMTAGAGYSLLLFLPLRKSFFSLLAVLNT